MAVENNVDASLLAAANTAPTNEEYEAELVNRLGSMMGINDAGYIRNVVNSVNPNYLQNPAEALKQLNTGNIPQQDLQNIFNPPSLGEEKQQLILNTINDKKLSLNETSLSKQQQVAEASVANKQKLDPSQPVDNSDIGLGDFIAAYKGKGIVPDEYIPTLYYSLKERDLQGKESRAFEEAQAYAGRTPEQLIQDTALSVAKFPSAVAETGYAVANLFTGGQLDNAINFSDNFKQTREIIESGQTRQTQLQRKYNSEELQQLEQQEELFRDSTQNIFSKLGSYAREYGKSAMIMTENPALLWDSVVESGLMFTVPAAVSSTVRKSVLNGLTDKQRNEFLADTAKMTNLEKNEKLAALASISALEAGGNALEIQNTILNTPFEQLASQGGLYTELIEQGVSQEEARKQVAANAFMTTYAVNFAGAGIVSKLTGSDKIAAELGKGIDTIGSRLLKTVSTGLSEGVEESAQSAIGQFAQNLGTSIADASQSLTEGLASAAGQGGLAGALSGAGIQSVVASAQTAQDALQPAIRKAAEVAQDTAVARQVEQAEAAGDFTSLAPTEAMSSQDVLLRMKRLATAIVKEDTITDTDKVNQINDVFEQLQDAYENKSIIERRQQYLQEVQTNPEKFPEVADQVAVINDPNSTQETKVEATDALITTLTRKAAEDVSTEIYDDETNTFNVATTRVAEAFKARVSIVANKIKEGTELSETEVNETVRTFGSNPDAFELNDINTFIESNQFNQLPKNQQTIVKAAQQYKQSLADAEEVSNVIRNGGDLGGQKWRGLRTYVNNFNTQLQRGNKTEATNIAEDLKRWYVTRKDKLQEWVAKPATPERAEVINTMKKENTAMMATLRLMAARMGTTVNKVATGTPNEQITDTPEVPTERTTQTEQRTEATPVTGSVETSETGTQGTELAQSGNTAEQAQPVTAGVDTQAEEHQDNSEINDTGLDIVADTTVQESTVQRLLPSFKQYVLSNAFSNLSFDSFYRLVQPKSQLGNIENPLTTSNDVIDSTFNTSELDITGFEEIKALSLGLLNGFNNIDFTVSEKDTAAFSQINQNPVFTMLNENGVLDSNIQQLMAISTIKVLATDYSLHSKTNSDSDIKSMLGVDTKEALPHTTLESMRNVGVSLTDLTRKVSQELENVLGVKPLKSLDNEVYTTALNALAGTAIAAAISTGYLERVNVDNRRFIRLPRTNNGNFTGLAQEIVDLKTQSNWFEALFNEENILNKPSILKPTKVDNTYSSNNPLYQLQRLPKQVTDILLKHSQRPNRILRDVYNYFEVLPVEAQRIVAGIVPDEMFKDKHIYERNSIQAANEAIEREYGNLLNFAQEVGDSQFYFNHVVWSNGRIGIDGSYINPQESKFIRHIANLSAFETKVDPTNEATMIDFKTAVGAAFGLKVDQADIKAINNKFYDLLEKGEILLVLRDLENNSFDNERSITRLYNVLSAAEHPTMAFHALVALREYINADGGPFTTTLSLEIDGKTNGFAFSALQFGSDSLEQLTESMERAGVYTTEGVNYNTWFNGGQKLDTYQLLAQTMNDLFNSNPKPETPASKILRTLVGFNVAIEEGSNRQVKLYTISRNLAKNPVMVTMYGAGINGVIDNFIEDVITNIYSTISSVNADKKIIKQETIRALKALKDPQTNESLIPEASVLNPDKANTEFVLTEEADTKLRNLLRDQYKDVMAEALDKMFGDINSGRNEVVRASQIAFNVFQAKYNQMYEAKLNEVNQNLYDELTNSYDNEKDLVDAFNYFKHSSLNKYQIQEVINELTKQYPVMPSYFLDTLSSGIVIPKSKNNMTALSAFLTRREFKVSATNAEGNEIPLKYTVTLDSNSRPVVRFNSTVSTVVTLSAKSNTGEKLQFNYSANQGTNFIPLLAAKSNTVSLTNIFGTALPRSVVSTSIKLKNEVTTTDINSAEKKSVNRGAKSLMMDSFNNSFGFIDPSVSIGPKMIHSLDGSNQLSIMKDIDMFNVHDAAYYVLGESSKGARLANKAFFSINKEFSVYDSAITMLEESAKLDTATEFSEDINNQIKTLKSIAETRNSIKEQYLNNIKGVYQFTYNIDGGYQPQAEDSANTTAALKAALSTNNVFGSSNDTLTNFNPNIDLDINQDNLVNIYNYLGTVGVQDPVQVSNNHQDKLNRILANVIHPLVEQTKLLVQDTSAKTLGLYERAGKDRVIKMQLGSQAPQVLAQSRQEVFVHELVHSVMETPIAMPTAYRKRLEQLYGIAQKYLSPADLLPATNNGLPHSAADLKRAESVYDYIFSNTRRINAATGIEATFAQRTLSNGLHEFVAFGLTNENVINALNNLFNNPDAVREFKQGEKFSPMKGNPQSGFFVSALNMVNEIFNYFMFKVRQFMDKVNGLEGKEADEVLFELVTRIAHVERKQSIKYDKLSDKGNALLSKASEQVLKPIATVLEKTNFTLAQAVGRTIRIIPRLDSNNIGNMFNRVVNHYGQTKDSLVASVGRELIGRTVDNRTMANLLMLSREWIDKLRAETSAAASTVVRSAFYKDLSASESGAIQRALMHTDAAAVFNGNTNDLLGLLSDTNKRNQEIARLQNELRTKAPTYFNFYNNHAENTGYFMVNKRPLYKGDVLFNATQIANLRTTDLTPKIDVNTVIDAIDKLTTLYAIKYTNVGDLSIAAQVIREEQLAKNNNSKNGVQFLMDSLKNYKKQSKEALFQNSDELMRKGYVKETFNPNTGFEVVTEEVAFLLEKQGVEVIGKVIKDEFDNNRINMYMVKSDALALNTRTRGAMSITGKTASGTTLTKAYNQISDNDTNSLMAVRDFAKLKSSRVGYRAMMLGTNPPKLQDGENAAIPVYDQLGNIAGYRYMMTETNRIKIAERSDLFDKTFGSMTALIGDKVNTGKINTMIIDELYRDYRANYGKNPQMFTKVSPTSSDKENQEMWALIPKDTRDYAKKVFGESAVYVSQENYRRVFGYKKADLGDFGNWIDSKLQNTYLESFGSMAKDLLNHKYTGLAESMWKDLVSFAKDRIVIVSGSVLLMNILSNMFVLFVEGVNPVKMVKYQKEAWEQLKQFQKDGIEMKKLTLMLADTSLTPAAIKRIKARIAQLNDKMTNNPVRPLLDRGVFQSIIEDVDMIDEQFSFKGKIERKLEPITDKIPDVVKDIGSAVFMTSNTSMYQFFRDATQMSDFVARYTLHKHNLDKGIKFEESIDNIMDTFINYEEPTHKTVQWLNDVGLFMFTKFFIRIQKVILRQLRDKPLNVFALWGVEQFLGVDLSTIDDSLASPQDFINRVYDPLDALETAITPPLPNLVY